MSLSGNADGNGAAKCAPTLAGSQPVQGSVPGSNHTSNGAGSPTGWAGTWGTLADGRCKVFKLAKRIEREMLGEVCASSPFDRRKVWVAAQQRALAEQLLDTLGTGSRRAVTSHLATARRELAGLERRPRQEGLSLAELLASSPEPAA